MYKIFNLIIIMNAVFSFKFHACGSYCGSGWCNNMWLDETLCNTDIYNTTTTESCGDLCCKEHDICCGQAKIKRKMCNKDMVKCLDYCNPLSLSCKKMGIPIPAGIIKLSIYSIKNLCCGQFCI